MRCVSFRIPVLPTPPVRLRACRSAACPQGPIAVTRRAAPHHLRGGHHRRFSRSAGRTPVRSQTASAEQLDVGIAVTPTSGSGDGNTSPQIHAQLGLIASSPTTTSLATFSVNVNITVTPTSGPNSGTLKCCRRSPSPEDRHRASSWRSRRLDERRVSPRIRRRISDLHRRRRPANGTPVTAAAGLPVNVALGAPVRRQPSRSPGGCGDDRQRGYTQLRTA